MIAVMSSGNIASYVRFMIPWAAYRSSLPPMTVMSDVSLRRIINSLPRAGRTDLIACGMMIYSIVVM